MSTFLPEVCFKFTQRLMIFFLETSVLVLFANPTLGIPLGAFRGASGTFKERLEKRVGARGERLVVGRVAARAARRPRRLPLGGASGRRG